MPGKIANEHDQRTTILSYKGTQEFHEWLSRLAAHCHLNKMALMDQSIVAYARTRDFHEQAPQRTSVYSPAGTVPPPTRKPSRGRGRKK